MSFLRLRLRLLQHLGCAQSRYLCDRVTKHCGEDVVGVGAKARAGTGHLAFPSDSPRDASVNLLPRFRMWQLGEKAARLEVPIADEVHSAQTGKAATSACCNNSVISHRSCCCVQAPMMRRRTWHGRPKHWAISLAQTPRQRIDRLATNLGRAGIEYALTGAAAGSLVGPFVTAITVVESLIRAKVALT